MSISRPVVLRLCRVLLSFFLAATAQANASTQVFLQLDGIPGESRDNTHKNWIEVSSFSHTIVHDLGPVRPIHYGIGIVKRVDASSPRLDFSCNRGQPIPKAVLEFTRLQDQQLRFYKIEMTNVVISAVQNSGSNGADEIFEYVELHYDTIQWSYTPFRPDGGTDEDVITWWDVPGNKGGVYGPTPDSDGDGTADDVDPDDDNDGMTDVYETANGLNPFSFDANSDLDHDGASNYNEFIAGTAANNANSVFRVTRTSLAPGSTQITWSSVAGKTYEIYSSDNLAGPYTLYSTVPSSGSGETSAVIPTSAGPMFFRLRVLP